MQLRDFHKKLHLKKGRMRKLCFKNNKKSIRKILVNNQVLDKESNAKRIDTGVVDPRTPGETIESDTPMEAMDKKHRTKDGKG